MLKLLTKIATDILPSVVATVIGAYIVNHYMTDKPAADVPAAANSVPDPQKADAGAIKASASEAGAPARGVVEKGTMEKPTAEGPVEAKPIEAKASEGKPAEPGSGAAPILPPHHQLVTHDRRVAKAANAPVAAPPVEPAADEHRSAVELAKAAIERLRGTGGKEPVRPAATAGISVVRPLPPPITVTMPASDYPRPATARPNDPNRPSPPADIPQPPELRADEAAALPRDNASNIADDMLSAARSMFHVVLPGQSKLPD